jgi:hypothetical protein
MIEYLKFPVNPNHLKQWVKIPVNRDGTPKRDSKEWKTMIANAMAKSPELRSAAERKACREEIEKQRNLRRSV